MMMRIIPIGTLHWLSIIDLVQRCGVCMVHVERWSVVCVCVCVCRRSLKRYCPDTQDTHTHWDRLCNWTTKDVGKIPLTKLAVPQLCLRWMRLQALIVTAIIKGKEPHYLLL